MLLAIDTATQMAGLALYDPAQEKVLAEEIWHSVNRHTVELMPRLARMVEQADLGPKALTGVAVAIGPGSFTGLRIGLSLAKGLVAALDLPIVGIPTLDVVAEAHAHQPRPIWAVVQAGRGRVCAARYRRLFGQWHVEMEAHITTLEALIEQIDDEVLVCGELDAADRCLLQDELGDLVAIPAAADLIRRPAHLAALGWRRLSQGDQDDPAALSPIYLHQPPAPA
jgi:tRNA threonylcarbamoyladenosine biosynthesis protein TsaB